jgi:hypothetical protein
LSGDQFLDRETLTAICSMQKILFILGDEVLVTGWGRITNNKKEGQDNFRRDRAGSDILKKVKVPIFKDSTCKSYNLDLDKQICAGGRKGVYKFIIFGIPTTNSETTNPQFVIHTKLCSN